MGPLGSGAYKKQCGLNTATGMWHRSRDVSPEAVPRSKSRHQHVEKVPLGRVLVDIWLTFFVLTVFSYYFIIIVLSSFVSLKC